MRTLRQMGVLEKLPRQGTISAKELAETVGKNEEVLGIFSPEQLNEPR